MSWTRPTLAQLQSRIAADLSGQLLDGGSLLSRSVLKVMATVWAGACHLMYGFLLWAFKQCFMDVCEAEFLERWARIWGVTRKAGAYAAGPVLVQGREGSVIPTGSLWRDARGLLYSSQQDSTVGDNGTGSVPLRAIEQGAVGNVEATSSLQLVSPLVGVNMEGSAGTITGGLDPESDELLRVRMLAKVQAPPHGGKASDYVQWALAVDGVTRAWCYPLYLGLGTVGVTFVCDTAEESIIPSQEMIDRVQAYIITVAPVTAAVLVFSPEAMPVNVTIRLTPYTQGTSDRILLELEDLFIREGAPGTVIPLSHINEAISITPGEFDHVLVEPTANIIPLSRQLPTLGTVVIGGAD